MGKSSLSKAPCSIVIGAVILATGCAEKSATRTSAVPTSAHRASAPDSTPGSGRGDARIAQEVRHELVMLPYYGIFDNLSYQVNGSTVTLAGQVTRPTLKSDAENVVKRIEGVDRVINNIEVLPLSPDDDRIRMATYRALYGDPALNRYAIQAVPPIHIIVRNGHVTLEGVVATESEKNIAGIRANSVPGAFS